jgi:transposase-like protein
MATNWYSGIGGGAAPRPTDTEVRRARPSWPASYKLAVLAEIDAAERGQVGEICRREGLYSSLISEWRKQRDRGALEGLADRKPGPAGADPVRGELARLREDNAKLREHVATGEGADRGAGKSLRAAADDGDRQQRDDWHGQADELIETWTPRVGRQRACLAFGVAARRWRQR